MPAATATRTPGRRTGAVRGGPATPTAVPWAMVLTLATVLAFADGFWLTSLRGAIGAIQRTQSPLTSWLRESAVMLPAFAVAVLGAFALALRWFGPGPLRGRAIPLTGLLVAAAGTLVGLAQTVINSVYDYRLQTDHLQHMDSMRSLCTRTCLAQARHATLLIHLHGVLYIARWLLLTNLVLIAWILAISGGRLAVGALRHPPTRPTYPRTSRAERATDTRLLLVLALAADAIVHAAATPGHIAETSGLTSLSLAIWALALAGMLLARIEDPILLRAAAALCGGTIAAWICAHTLGLPFGADPAMFGGIGLTDLTARVLETVALLAAILILRAQPPSLPRPPVSAHTKALACAALLAVTVIGAAGTGPSWFDAFGLAITQPAEHAGH